MGSFTPSPEDLGAGLSCDGAFRRVLIKTHLGRRTPSIALRLHDLGLEFGDAPETGPVLG